MAVRFYFVGVKKGIDYKNKIRKWLKEQLYDRKILKYDINIVFMSDDHLLKVHKNHLNKDTYTDVITFHYDNDKELQIELMISYERAGENAKKYKVSLQEEIIRLISHGILHTQAYSDNNPKRKTIMVQEENRWIACFYKTFHVKPYLSS